MKENQKIYNWQCDLQFYGSDIRVKAKNKSEAKRKAFAVFARKMNYHLNKSTTDISKFDP